MKCTKCGAQIEPGDLFCNQCGAQLGEDFLIENGVLKQYQGHERELVVPHGVTKIAPMVFAQKNLRQITLPKGLTWIGHHAFAETELEIVTIPASVRTIGEGAFYGCRSLKNVDIQAGTQQIENAAFFDCVSLEKITIPNSVKKIGEMAFQGCSSLTQIDLPDSVQEIGQAACINCTNLKTVHIPEGLQSIPANMFECCEGLTSAAIPSQTIGIGAFLNCTSLRTVRLSKRLQRIEKAAFKGCDRIIRVQYDGSQAEKDALVIAPGNESLTKTACWKDERDQTDNPPKRVEVHILDNKQKTSQAAQNETDKTTAISAELQKESASPQNGSEEPPVIWSDNWNPCPRCDGYISNGVCDRCGLDTRRASGSIAAPSPKPVKEDSSVRKSNAADAVRRTQSTESNPAQNKKQASAELKTESDKSRKSSYIIVLLLLVVFGIFSVVTTLLSLAEEIDSDYAWIFILLGLISFGGMIYWLSAAPKKPNVWIGLPAIVFTACGGFPGIIFAVWGYAQARKAGNNRRNPSTLWRLCMCSFALMPAALLVWPGLIIGIIEGSL